MDVLRQGWPAALLSGCYAVVERELNGGALRDVLEFLDVVDGPDRTREVVVDGRVLFDARERWCLRTAARPRIVVLQLVLRRPPRGVRKPFPKAVRDFLLGDHVRDVADPRSGTHVGTVIQRAGRRRWVDCLLVDAAGRTVAVVTTVRGQVHVLDTAGVVVGRMWGTPRRRGNHLNVDVSTLAGRVDPRLILACALTIS
jgi:hypothetical protein